MTPKDDYKGVPDVKGVPAVIGEVPDYVKRMFQTMWPHEPPPLPPITLQVKELEERAEKALALAGEILATLTLKANQHWFQRMPEDWHMMVQTWQARYRHMAPDKEGGTQ